MTVFVLLRIIMKRTESELNEQEFLCAFPNLIIPIIRKVIRRDVTESGQASKFTYLSL